MFSAVIVFLRFQQGILTWALIPFIPAAFLFVSLRYTTFEFPPTQSFSAPEEKFLLTSYRFLYELFIGPDIDARASAQLAEPVVGEASDWAGILLDINGQQFHFEKGRKLPQQSLPMKSKPSTRSGVVLLTSPLGPLGYFQRRSSVIQTDLR